MAVAPYRSGQALGWLNFPTGSSTASANAAANWVGFSFVADSGRTLSTARVFVSALSGTLGASDMTCDLYDSAGTSGAPGAAIESGKLPTATITASNWYTFTGFTTALTAGQTYWLVIKNVNGVPASNFATFRAASYVTAAAYWLLGSTTNRQCWGFANSTNSGSTWSLSIWRLGLRVGYADGSYDGMPTSAAGAAAVGDGVYAAREGGVKFTSPNAVLKVAGLAMLVTTKTGSPTGAPQLGLWTGGGSPTLLAYTNPIPATAITTTQWVYSYFSSVQTIQPGTVCRVTLGETAQADSSGNRWNNLEVTWDTDANSQILLPWNGTATKTYFDGTSTWTDSPLGTSMFGHALLLDPSVEFGTGPIISRATINRGQQSY